MCFGTLGTAGSPLAWLRLPPPVLAELQVGVAVEIALAMTTIGTTWFCFLGDFFPLWPYYCYDRPIVVSDFT